MIDPADDYTIKDRETPSGLERSTSTTPRTDDTFGRPAKPDPASKLNQYRFPDRVAGLPMAAVIALILTGLVLLTVALAMAWKYVLRTDWIG